MSSKYALNPHALVRFLEKDAKDFTKDDIIRYVTENFIINSLDHLDNILTCGERVDGSSLFPYIEAGSSDLYVLPRYRTAFLNPFSEIPAVDILCSFYMKDGKPLEMSPEYTMRKAHEVLKQVTGMEYEVMGELEYYVVSEKDDLFLASDQKGYHESTPFNKGRDLRALAMKYIAGTGGLIKYGHSEVGNFTKGDLMYEQNEIEFLPTKMEDAADQLIIAKWILRTLAYQFGVDLTFAPKITVGKAGSGLHIHTRLKKGDKNMMIENGKLTDSALKAIAGYLDLAPSLTAFGNTNPMSYFRLVPHQEAPTNICWGDRNRSVLVRVPLGWTSGAGDMLRDANPLEKVEDQDFSGKQTVEFRCPDGSSDVYLLIAGLAVAVRHGFEMKDALQYAKERYVDVNIFDDANKGVADRLSQLPASCYDSALCLEKQRADFEKYGVFAPGLIDGLVAGLKKFDDKTLRQDLGNDEAKIMELVQKYFYCG